jgi:hypothetical protein
MCGRFPASMLRVPPTCGGLDVEAFSDLLATLHNHRLAGRRLDGAARPLGGASSKS